jgi:KOW motif.
MKVKVGDKVKVLAGKDKGKEGRVLVTLRKKTVLLLKVLILLRNI